MLSNSRRGTSVNAEIKLRLYVCVMCGCPYLKEWEMPVHAHCPACSVGLNVLGEKSQFWASFRGWVRPDILVIADEEPA